LSFGASPTPAFGLRASLAILPPPPPAGGTARREAGVQAGGLRPSTAPQPVSMWSFQPSKGQALRVACGQPWHGFHSGTWNR